MSRVAGTGHRPQKLGGYSDEVLAKLTRLAQHVIDDLEATHIITGMALGWDTALALAAVSRKVPFTAAIPFAGQEGRWPEASQRRYHALLDVADEVVVVCDGGFASWKMMERNRWMVQHCDLLAALWDGSNSGTSNCVRYAHDMAVVVHNYWQKWRELNG